MLHSETQRSVLVPPKSPGAECRVSGFAMQVDIRLDTSGEVALTLTVPNVAACEGAIISHTFEVQVKALVVSRPVAPEGVVLTPQPDAVSAPTVTTVSQEDFWSAAEPDLATAATDATEAATAGPAAGPSGRVTRSGAAHAATNPTTASNPTTTTAAPAAAAPATTTLVLSPAAQEQLTKLSPDPSKRRYMVLSVQDGRRVVLKADFQDEHGSKTTCSNPGLQVYVLGASDVVTASVSEQAVEIEVRSLLHVTVASPSIYSIVTYHTVKHDQHCTLPSALDMLFDLRNAVLITRMLHVRMQGHCCLCTSPLHTCRSSASRMLK